MYSHTPLHHFRWLWRLFSLPTPDKNSAGMYTYLWLCKQYGHLTSICSGRGHRSYPGPGEGGAGWGWRVMGVGGGGGEIFPYTKDSFGKISHCLHSGRWP